VIGCLALASAVAQTAAPAAGAAVQSPTYLRDILPIFMGNCSRCHNQQSRFVYNWLDYKTAFADRWEIRRRVWDSYQGSYYKEAMPIANSPESQALTDEDRLTIRNWVNGGGLRGVEPSADGPKTKVERIALGRRFARRVISPPAAACQTCSRRWPDRIF
jgi:uncharacterized membrane protein